mmetsp:Transcript_2734/g.7544  ORF Transcript_2734/g.7544 Transcript_2734/m.7544 type:complete len:116 (+) Transcript_2734:115-462(+)
MLGPVEVVGTVVDVRRQDQYVAFSLDDGTGLLLCVVWPGERGVPGWGELPPGVVQLGQCVRCRGVLRRQQLRGGTHQSRLDVHALREEPDPLAEALHWVQCLHLRSLRQADRGTG